jgi:hypothetical protein
MNKPEMIDAYITSDKYDIMEQVLLGVEYYKDKDLSCIHTARNKALKQGDFTKRYVLGMVASILKDTDKHLAYIEQF